MTSIGAMSNYLENKVIDHLFRNTTLTSSGSTWIALYYTDPTDNNSGIEVSGSGYTRVSSSGTVTGAPYTVSGSYASNANIISFPTVTGSGWGNVGYFGICTGSESGSLLFYGALSSASTPVLLGEIVRIASGNLSVSLGSPFFMSASVSGSLLKLILNGESYASPGSAVYTALFNSARLLTTPPPGDPTDSVPNPGVGTYYFQEVVGGSTVGYSRLPVGGSGSWTSPVDGSAVNTGSMVFSYASSGSWGEIQALGIYDASSGGNLILWGRLPTYKRVYNGDGFYIPAGGITIRVDDETASEP